MKNSLMLFWFVTGTVLTGSLAMPAQAQNSVVYAAEYNRATNRFGTIDLVSGNFTRISSFGRALINDVAFCPTNGEVYAISNSSVLVTFNKTNGAITRVASLSASGIQSLAFRPGDGALFGATQSKLYRINPASGTATSIGNYGSPKNLNNRGQNIRFAQDGNLYMSNTSTNTDIYRINTSNGSATWMGEAVGYPYLMLQNSGSNMYSVFINLGSATNEPPKLVGFDLNSFVVGGTNANGSTHQITVQLVGAGTNFPANFTFSGAYVSQPITNLTVPVSATGPANQTAGAGETVVLSTVASGTPPYSYAWLKNGSVLSGQTNSSLTLNSVSASDAATYSVIVSGAIGRVTNSATLTVTKASAIVTLAGLSQTYDGTPKAATATTIPGGLAVTFTYNGSATAPTAAGIYTVVATIDDANYQGSANDTLAIEKATLTVSADNKSRFRGQSNPTLTANYCGFVNGEDTGVLASPVGLNTTATTGSDEGEYPITAGGAAAANYTINYVSGTLSVKAAPQLTGRSAIVNGNNQFVISWLAAGGHTYQLECTDDLAGAAWNPAGNPVVGTDAMVYVTNNVSDAVQRFFRLGAQ
jgi:hypothetical protein